MALDHPASYEPRTAGADPDRAASAWKRSTAASHETFASSRRKRNRAGSAPELHSHWGDEHHIVLSGRLRVRQGDYEVELGPGDYLLWDATIPHAAEPIGDEPVEVLIITHRSHEGTSVLGGAGGGTK